MKTKTIFRKIQDHLRNLIWRFKIILRVLSTKHNFLISLDKEDMLNLINGNDYDIRCQYSGLREYYIGLIINKMSKIAYDDVDLVLLKAANQAEYDLYREKELLKDHEKRNNTGN